MNQPKQQLPKQLSTVSKQYDLEGKGHLSEKQQMLRNMGIQGETARDFFLRNASKIDTDDLKEFAERHNELRSDNKELQKSQEELLRDNKKLKRNQILLGSATLLMGIATIAATVLAIRSAQVTVVGEDGTLVGKDSGQEVAVKSKGVSALTWLVPNGDEDPYECISPADAAILYKGFVEGSNTLVLTNDSAVTGMDYGGSTMGVPVKKLQGSTAFSNDSHIMIGDFPILLDPDNPCSSSGAVDYPQGSRQLFHDHLNGKVQDRELWSFLGWLCLRSF